MRFSEKESKVIRFLGVITFPVWGTISLARGIKKILKK